MTIILIILRIFFSIDETEEESKDTKRDSNVGARISRQVSRVSFSGNEPNPDYEENAPDVDDMKNPVQIDDMKNPVWIEDEDLGDGDHGELSSSEVNMITNIMIYFASLSSNHK